MYHAFVMSWGEGYGQRRWPSVGGWVERARSSRGAAGSLGRPGCTSVRGQPLQLKGQARDDEEGGGGGKNQRGRGRSDA